MAEEEYDHLDHARANTAPNPNYTRMQTIPRSDRSARSIASTISSNTNVPNIPTPNGSMSNGIGGGGGSSSLSHDSNNLNSDTIRSKNHNQKLALFSSSEENDD